MDIEGKFFIGREYDWKKGSITEEPITYDPDDLTTHGVVLGMTGSGKTGLCIDILEEAALNNIPAIIVDPKGDIANLMLHFPQLKPDDFQPWLDQDQVRREGKTLQEAAESIAALWKKGLGDWGIDEARIQRVKDSVQYSIFTPGSDAAIPVSVLASLRAPDLDWDENHELMLEVIASTATALLALVGVTADPVRSREHILIANLLEKAWSAGEDLSLEHLIELIQNPPFEKLGALDVEKFYPSSDRFELAMLLNNLLAAPTFEAWREGAPLDVERFLWTADGKARHTIFYLSHLPESERMFFVTLLLAAIEAWMRRQSGSSSLQALLYFDEVLGYLPPVSKPPSKPLLIRLLKQARAFGLGLLLTTQNPIDLDYKALSNAGTWFIGKLQTEQDKARVLDGLEGISIGDSGLDRKKVDTLISSLDKRVFLLHNVHEDEPEVFYTRWAMAYLGGPITRDKLAGLNDMVGADKPAPEQAPRSEAGSTRVEKAEPASRVASSSTLSVRPKTPAGFDDVLLPNNLSASEAVRTEGLPADSVTTGALEYHPVLLAQAAVRYLDRKHDIDHTDTVTALVTEPDARGMIRWDDFLSPAVDLDALSTQALKGSAFADLEAPLDEKSLLSSMKTDFADYIYHDCPLVLLSNEELELVAKPGTSKAEFHRQCSRAAREKLDEETDGLKDKYKKKIKTLQDKVEREERELAEDEAELSSRKMEEIATHAENVLTLFTSSSRSRRVSTSLSKRRMTAKAKADVEESRDAIEDYKKDLAEIEAELADELDELEERWEEIAARSSEVKLTPYKKDIHVDLFGVAWMPYWQVEQDGETFSIPGYQR